MGNGELIDALMYDGLTDAYSNKPMGTFADQCAAEVRLHPAAAGRLRRREPRPRPQGRRRRGLRRRDRAGRRSPSGARPRRRRGRGPEQVRRGEAPRPRAAFSAEGTVTAGNASSINDGAAALLVASPASASELGLKPRARIVGAPSTARSRSGSRPRRSAPSRSCSTRSAGASPTSTCSRSTRPSPSSTLAAGKELGCRPRRPTSTAAPCRWATRSAAAVRGSWSRS